MEVLYAEAEQALIDEEWAKFGKKVKKGQERRKAWQDLQSSGTVILDPSADSLELGHQRMPRTPQKDDEEDDTTTPKKENERGGGQRRTLKGSSHHLRNPYPPAPSLVDATHPSEAAANHNHPFYEILNPDVKLVSFSSPLPPLVSSNSFCSIHLNTQSLIRL